MSLKIVFVIFVSACLPINSNAFRICADERYTVSWQVEELNSSITFSILVETNGFIGLGFSRGGGMAGADIVIAGVRNGVPYLEDRHAISQSTPILDISQNVELLEAWENATHTFVKFTREFETCDEQDVAITADTINLIWSFGATDDLSYHGTNRGSRTVNLLDPQGPVDPDLSGYEKWELRTTKTMPAADTTYWCTIHKSPNVSQKHHIIAFNAILEVPDARVHTHHMEAYLCDVPPGMEPLFDEYIGHPGDDCYYPTDPRFPGHYCELIAYGWAIGGEVVLFPPYVGFPLVSGQYFKLEVHYNNPGELENVQFDTGLTLYHTSSLRLFDAGRLAVGSEINYTQMIPPNSESFTTVAHCHVDCTAELPPNGVAMFNFLIHAHLSGRKLKLRHFRNGTELPWLINDENYDFNFQATRAWPREMRIFAGDHLSFECEYNNLWKEGEPTLGGRSTREEMCMAFLSYYPRIEGLVSCNSEVKKGAMLDFFGVQSISLPYPADTDPVVEEPLPLKGKRFSEVVQMVNWTEGVRASYQRIAREDPHSGYCRPSGAEMEVGYPEHGEDYEPINVCQRRS